MDHPGALRHPADGEAVERDRRLLRARVGGEDRLGGVRATVGRERGHGRLRARRGRGRAAAAARSRRSRGRAPPRPARSSSRPASAAVAIASSTPRSPVAAFATPELTTIACGSAAARCSFVTITGAAWTRLTVCIAVPTAGTVERTTARSFSFRRMPAWTPAATKPLAAVTLTPGPRRAGALPSRRARARGSRSAPPGRRRPCRGCRARRRRSRCRSSGR